MEKASKTRAIYLVLDTPGGSVTSGLAFIDVIKSLNVKVHTITIFAASMGYQIAQELGTRYITPSGTLMSHRGSVGGISGQVPGELNSRLAHIQAILDGMSERAAKRVRMSKKDYDAAIVNELWVFGQQAVSTHHADIVANVTCSEKLVQGTYTEEVSTLFGPVTLVFSKCPLVSYPVRIQFGKSIAPENFEKVKQLLNMKKKSVNLIF
jgi:ATP-dependent Clp protease protease subunit